MNVLIAVDKSECSMDAVREVARRPWPPGSKARVVTVVNPGPWEGLNVRVDGYASLKDALADQAQSTLSTSLRLLSDGCHGLDVSTRALEGPPIRAILDEAAAWKADLIVVGSHGRGCLERFHLGSISHAIVVNAECSVEVVRCSCRDE